MGMLQLLHGGCVAPISCSSPVLSPRAGRHSLLSLDTLQTSHLCFALKKPMFHQSPGAGRGAGTQDIAAALRPTDSHLCAGCAHAVLISQWRSAQCCSVRSTVWQQNRGVPEAAGSHAQAYSLHHHRWLHSILGTICSTDADKIELEELQ